jgi:hypothetical protein
MKKTILNYCWSFLLVLSSSSFVVATNPNDHTNLAEESYVFFDCEDPDADCVFFDCEDGMPNENANTSSQIGNPLAAVLKFVQGHRKLCIAALVVGTCAVAANGSSLPYAALQSIYECDGSSECLDGAYVVSSRCPEIIDSCWNFEDGTPVIMAGIARTNCARIVEAIFGSIKYGTINLVGFSEEMLDFLANHRSSACTYLGDNRLVRLELIGETGQECVYHYMQGTQLLGTFVCRVKEYCGI